jgi:hypothetical protein
VWDFVEALCDDSANSRQWRAARARLMRAYTQPVETGPGMPPLRWLTKRLHRDWADAALKRRFGERDLPEPDADVDDRDTKDKLKDKPGCRRKM